MQDHWCAVAVSSKGAAGVAAPEVELNEMVEPPAATAARHAAKYCNNMHPVRALPDHFWQILAAVICPDKYC